MDKNAAQHLQKNKWSLLLEVTPKTQKLEDNVFGQVWEYLGKNPLHPQKFACCYTYRTDELWKLATANIALHSVFTQMSELNLNEKDVLPQACKDVF